MGLPAGVVNIVTGDGQVGGLDAETRGEDAVEGRGGAAPLDVAEHGHPGLEPGAFLDLGSDGVRDPAEPLERRAPLGDADAAFKVPAHRWGQWPLGDQCQDEGSLILRSRWCRRDQQQQAEQYPQGEPGASIHSPIIAFLALPWRFRVTFHYLN